MEVLDVVVLHMQDQLEHNFKAETSLNRLLREKLLSKELELEQLEAGLASSLRTHDVLQNEIRRLQDELSCLNHKTKEMELQMMRTGLEERDQLWEEVKHSGETIIMLEHEVVSLKKKIDALDEDVLIKEGQITILKDSLGDKPFDTVYSPKSVKEFALE
ncbi:hypothetical protein J5N97_001316 [Dioscorea zingiberensis]|uniref:Uncharacterized protein n=1 Tax=Dioscorea zingiberensis TaxID=325984 RepID=A0A9D5BUE3_9LILI|nr:hypothetical protein J5N97_001316 [Dioscorea zingiberensis]